MSARFDLEGTVQQYKDKKKRGQNYSSELSVIAQHFHMVSDQEYEQFWDFPVDDVQKLIECPELRLKSEDQLAALLIKLTREKDFAYGVLLDHVKAAQLKAPEHQAYACMCHTRKREVLEDPALLRSLTEWFTAFSDSSAIPAGRYKEIAFQRPELGRGGVLSYLRKTSGSVLPVEATVSGHEDTGGKLPDSEAKYLKELLEREDGVTHPHGWASAQHNNPTLQLKFATVRVQVTGYTLKFTDLKPMSSWNLEVSADGITWIAIDTRNPHPIPPNYSIQHYTCTKGNANFYQYLRIRSSDTDARMSLAMMEFYGRLQFL